MQEHLSPKGHRHVSIYVGEKYVAKLTWHNSGKSAKPVWVIQDPDGQERFAGFDLPEAIFRVLQHTGYVRDL